MAITIDSTGQVTQIGDGLLTAFGTVYPFLANADLTVEVQPTGAAYATKVLGVDYNVTGANVIDETTGARSPGTVTFFVAPAALANVRITRNTPVLQPDHLRKQGGFSPATLEEMADRATMWGQDLKRRIATLEAGGIPVALPSAEVTDTFVVADPIESNFPRPVACAGTPKVVLLSRLEDLSDGTTIAQAAGFPDWGSPALNQFTVRYIPGLVPGHQYRVTYLVITA